MQRWHWRLEAIGIVVLLLPLLLYAIPHFQRPPQTLEAYPLFQGITYRREALFRPRPIVLHTVSIDLNAPGVEAFVTPGTPKPNDQEINARTTSEFLQEFKLQLAVNANFFYPFEEDGVWRFYPHSGDRVNAVGQAISNGQAYSAAESSFPVVCFAGRRAQVAVTGICPVGTQQAVAGSPALVLQGKPVPPPQNAPDNNGLYSRTVLAINATGEKLWLLAVDDKQPLYSEGVTLAEMTELVLRLGADSAVNLDGGGSTTLVRAMGGQPKLLNAAIHTRIPLRERPVANHLGFYAKS
ncbi:MAG TPA: phosphodiester glycosidase family protein [Thermosynechococcaceae cyanobacterium]